MRPLALLASLTLLAGCSGKQRRDNATWPWREFAISVPAFAEATARIDASLVVSGVIVTDLYAGGFCECDHEQLGCVIKGAPAPGIDFTLRGPSDHWPKAPAPMGVCNAAGRQIVVKLVPQLDSNEPYWLDEGDLVVPLAHTGAARLRTWTIPLPPEVPSTAEGVLGGRVACRVDAEARVVVVSSPSDVETSVVPCLTWEGGARAVRVVALRP